MNTPPAAPRRTIRCPGCGGASVYAPENAFRPFCSARCRNHDFGAWASEDYAVAAAPPREGDDEDGAPRPRPASQRDSQ